jgi:small subunit ribosomal protein S6
MPDFVVSLPYRGTRLGLVLSTPGDNQRPGANPKRGDRRLYDYEVALIIRPEVEEEGQEEIIERLSQILTADGGQVANVEKWGRRRLAYPINKVNEGTYFFIQGQFSASVLSELERNVRLSESILRHMVLRTDR